MNLAMEMYCLKHLGPRSSELMWCQASSSTRSERIAGVTVRYYVSDSKCAYESGNVVFCDLNKNVRAFILNRNEGLCT